MTSKIDWCDETINPFTGCRHGCSFCYARRMAHRLANIRGTVYERVALAGTDADPVIGIAPGDGDPFAPAIHLDASHRAFEKLCRARKPKRVFVGSMGDMCFEGEALAWGHAGNRLGPGWTTVDLQKLIAKWTSEQPRHTFLLLTKRPDLLSPGIQWTSNVHLGVSVTCDADAGRIATLIGWCRANHVGRPGVVWASVEPLLLANPHNWFGNPEFNPEILTGLDWVVIGAQTGPGARVTEDVIEAAWRTTVWCAQNGVPCWVKDNMRKHLPNFAWLRELPEVPQ